MRPRPAVAAVLLLVLGLLTACGDSPAASPDAPGAPIRVASYDFSENQILAEVYAEAIRRAGLAVQVQHGIGTREVVEPALEQGVVDVVIDYLGTALTFTRPGTAPLERTAAGLHAALARTLEPRGVTVLDAASAEDQNAFAVTAAFADEQGVSRLSDLADRAPDLVFGGPPECPERPLCLLGLARVYGLQFGTVQTMASRDATVEALLSGQIDVGLLETTDARLGVTPLVLLADDRGLQPRENVVPLVRSAVLERAGARLGTALDQVSARLTTADLVALNGAVVLDGLTPAEAAARWWAGD